MREEEFRSKQRTQQEIRAASQDTFGRVGKTALTGDLQADTGIGQQQARALNVDFGDAEFAAADRAQLADTLRQNAQSQGAAVPALPTMTREMAEEQYGTRLSAIDPERGQTFRAGSQQLRKGQFELDGLQRDADFTKRVDAAMQGVYADMAKRLQSVETIAQTDGMKGLVTTFGPELRKAFPGMDVSLVGNNIVVRQGKKTVQTIGNINEAVSALQGVAQLEFAGKMENAMVTKGLFKTPQDMVTFFRDRENNARAGRESDSRINLQGAQATNQRAQAGYYNTRSVSDSQRTGNWTPVGTDRDGTPVSYDRNSGQFARADGKPVQDTTLFRKVTGAPAAKEVSAADINNFMKDQAGAVVRVDKNTGKPVRLSDLPLSEQRALAIETLGGAAPATAGGSSLPDADPSKMRLPGQPASAGQSQALPLSQRLGVAAQADVGRTDKLNFMQLSNEVLKAAPALEAQAKSLRSAIPNVQNPETKAILEAQLQAVEEDLQLVPGILQQRSAILGR
jgi:hypothetical protein